MFEQIRHYWKIIKDNRKIAVILAATLILAVFSMQTGRGNELKEARLERPGYSELQRQIPVRIYAEGIAGGIDTVIDLMPQKYSPEQIKPVLDEVYQKAEIKILQNNANFQQIASDLNLVSRIDGYPVTIQWYSSDYTIIDYEGHVHNEHMAQGQQQKVLLTAVLCYEEYKEEYQIEACVIPPNRTEQELFWSEVQEAVSQAVNEEGQAYVELPAEVDGTALRYFISENETSPFAIIFIGVAAALVILARNRQRQRDALEKRKNQLKRDYPEMVSKLTLLIGAGMTIRRSWEKIVMDYQKSKEKRQDGQRYLYEEMAETLNQMRAGIPEQAAYEQFGRRCDTREYLKFSTLLIQNMKKGTEDMSAMLQLEVAEAFEQQKNMAKKLGEEAGTKLLFPMIIMLAVIMAIIMIPAMISFNS